MPPQPDSAIEPGREPQLYAAGSLLVALFGVVVLAVGFAVYSPIVPVGMGLGGAAAAVGAIHLRRALSATGGERARAGEEAPGSDESAFGAGRDPIGVLKERYAAGEIDDAEFERRLGRLLELESDEGEEARNGRSERGRRDGVPARER